MRAARQPLSYIPRPPRQGVHLGVQDGSRTNLSHTLASSPSARAQAGAHSRQHRHQAAPQRCHNTTESL